MNQDKMAAYWANTIRERDELKEQLNDCINELCLHCGKYKDEHLGACEHCKWEEIRDKWA